MRVNNRRYFVVGAEFQKLGLELIALANINRNRRSEEHTSELQSLMRISYAVFCLKKKKTITADQSISEVNNKIKHKINNDITNTSHIKRIPYTREKSQ